METGWDLKDEGRFCGRGFMDDEVGSGSEEDSCTCNHVVTVDGTKYRVDRIESHK